MKYILIILALLLMCVTAAGAVIQTVNAPYLAKAPVIDGVISGSEWEQASGAPVALDFKSGQATAVTSEFRIGRVGDLLYFMFDASRIGRLPLFQKRDRDGAVWDDDGVELFLSSGETRLHTIINAGGDIYDASITAAGIDSKWNGAWTVRSETVKQSKVVSGGYVIEGSLDLSKLPVAIPKDSDIWGLQVAFNLRYHNPMAVWHVPAPGEFQSDFGKLIWGGKTARISRVALAKAGAGLSFAGEFTEPAQVTFNGQSEPVTGSVKKVFDMPADHKYTLSATGSLFSYEISGSVPNGIELDSSFISPNGDGLNDKLTASFFTVPGEAFTVDIADKSGKSVGYIVHNKMAVADKSVIEWNGKSGNKILPDGDYTIRLLGGAGGSVTGTAPVKLDTSVKVAPIKYNVKPFFPIGTWFEGHPGMAKYPWDPAGAESFYDNHFGIMEANGINFVAVPNLPENLQDPLLRMAEKHNIKIAMFVASLYDLVGNPERVTEAEVLAACKKEYARLGKYPALIRYQVKDEPYPSEIPNLITVQRILAMVDPTRLAFSCFQQPPALQKFVESSVLTEAVFDHYPITGKTPAGSIGDFMAAYPYWVRTCGNNNHWTVLQAFYRMDDWREPSAEELRAMTYVALAYGAKGVVFFLYNHMPGMLNGMVSPDGTTQPMFEKTTVLTKELVKIKPLLIDLKQTGKAESDYKDYVVGRFITPKKQSILIVASGRADISQIVRVTGAAGEWRDAITGQRFSSSGSVLIVPLSPGVGRVLVKE